jgi:predicted secreted protein
MTISFAVAVYLCIWFITLFAVLPFGVRTQDEAGEVVPGTPESAPAAFRFGRVFVWNTAVATVCFAVFYVAYTQNWLGLVATPPRI